MGESEQIEMNKNVFWELIAQAKAQYGQDMGAAESWLTDELVKRGPRAAQSFHDIIHAYSDLADRYGLWDAASIIKEYGCSDGGLPRGKKFTWPP